MLAIQLIVTGVTVSGFAEGVYESWVQYAFPMYIFITIYIATKAYQPSVGTHSPSTQTDVSPGQ